jgi:hypothetical protein
MPKQSLFIFIWSLSHSVGELEMTRDETESMFGSGIVADEPFTLVQRRAFLKLPVKKRMRLLAEQQSRQLAGRVRPCPDVLYKP